MYVYAQWAGSDFNTYTLCYAVTLNFDPVTMVKVCTKYEKKSGNTRQQ